jgi:hypothetical protein
MITYYTEIPNRQKAEELLRILEDARYTSYDNEFDSSHNGIICGRFKYVGLWDDKSYVGYRKKNNVELRPGTELSWNKFIEFLDAEVNGDLD